MEQQGQSRAPVNLNALLIGEKTIPKGCRVLHVSGHGMLLHCEPDGRQRTFNDGDSVDIHLKVQHNGEQKKLTIPSRIRHVADNSFDVEFQHPDPVLLDLIESYRVSDSHTLEASVDSADANAAEPEIIPLPTARERNLNDQPPASRQKQATGGLSRWSNTVIMLLIAGAMGAGLYVARTHDNRLDLLEASDNLQIGELREMKDQLFAASLLEGKYASLDARITAQGNALATLERQLHESGRSSPVKVAKKVSGKIQRQAVPKTAEPVAPVTPAPATAGTQPRVTTDTPADTTVRKPTAADNPSATSPGQTSTPPVTSGTEQPAADSAPARQATSTESVPATRPARGPWAINLMSSVDRGYIEQSARNAERRNIPVTVISANVKGRQYWRLQVTGYPSLAAARADAPAIQKKMNIDSVWFHKYKKPPG